MIVPLDFINDDARQIVSFRTNSVIPTCESTVFIGSSGNFIQVTAMDQGSLYKPRQPQAHVDKFKGPI